MSKLSAQRWAELLSAYPGSGLSHRDFARLHKVSVHTFRAKLYAAASREALAPPVAAPPDTEPFLRLQLQPSPHSPADSSASGSPALSLSLGKARLDFARLPDAAWLAAVLTQLSGEAR